MTKLDYSLISNIEMYINYKDAPDFADSYIISADYAGEPMTEEQLDIINSDDDFVYESILNIVY